MKRLGVLFAAASVSCAVVLAQGCSSGERTTTTTSATRADGGAVTSDYGGPQAGYGQPPPSTITTTTTKESNEPDSVLGATTHAVVTIVMLPFRVVGDALGLII
jgi:hypothetical protein